MKRYRRKENGYRMNWARGSDTTFAFHCFAATEKKFFWVVSWLRIKNGFIYIIPIANDHGSTPEHRYKTWYSWQELTPCLVGRDGHTFIWTVTTGQTVTSEVYSAQWQRKLCTKNATYQYASKRSKIIFQHDNVQPHVARSTVKTLLELN